MAQNNYHSLLTPQNCAVAFIDYQPQMLFGVASMDRQSLVNNAVLFAKAVKLFNVPAVLTTVETKGFSGYTFPQLVEALQSPPIIERTSMNSWDDPAFRKAIEATGRKNIILCGLWTEVCITWPTLEMLAAGYNMYVVQDACGATSPAAEQAALSRMEQAGAVRLTTIPALLEFQRDWKNKEHYDALMALLREHAGAYGAGVEYAYTMVHKQPQFSFAQQFAGAKSH